MPWSQRTQTSEHGSTKYYIYKDDRPIEKIHDIIKINGWDVVFEADENGKLDIIARKTLGKFGIEESILTFSLETTSNRVPKFRALGRYGMEESWIELDDHKDRTAESYKKYEYPRREYTKGSVLTVYEFLREIVPEFEKVLCAKEIDGHVSKISEQTAQLQPPHNKVYRVVN